VADDRSNAKSAPAPRTEGARSSWNGIERRRKPDRRSRQRRLDERRRAGIGEIIDDRRADRSRRKSDARANAGKAGNRRGRGNRRTSDDD